MLARTRTVVRYDCAVARVGGTGPFLALVGEAHEDARDEEPEGQKEHRDARGEERSARGQFERFGGFAVRGCGGGHVGAAIPEARGAAALLADVVADVALPAGGVTGGLASRLRSRLNPGGPGPAA